MNTQNTKTTNIAICVSQHIAMCISDYSHLKTIDTAAFNQVNTVHVFDAWFEDTADNPEL